MSVASRRTRSPSSRRCRTFAGKAPRAYWYSVEGKSNLKIIRGTAWSLVWADTDKSDEEASGGISATDVEYLTEDGQAVVVSATKEVVLSAGSLKSPLIL